MEKLRSVQNIRNKKNRRQAGFTMAELLIVIAIILIVAGFGFVNVIRYQKDLKLKECDDIARQIFIAAQNQLTASDAAGRWNFKVDNNISDAVNGEPTEYGTAIVGVEAIKQFNPDYAAKNTNGLPDYYFYFTNVEVNATENNRFNTLILPFGSIDETVRTGGKYVIAYCANTKTIASVVYTDDTGVSSIAADSAADTISAWNVEQTNNVSKDTRRNYRVDGHNTLIGCYGFGLNAFIEGDNIERPIVWLENAEALVLHISDDPMLAASGSTNEKYATKITVMVQGNISGASRNIIITGEATGGDTFKISEVTSSDNSSSDDKMITSIRSAYYTNGATSSTPYEHRIYLDRITEPGGNFAAMFPEFIPGEDVNVTVFFEKKTPDGVVSESKKVTATANSLFRNTMTFTTSSGTAIEGSVIAYLSNGRHLQNLTREVSNVGAEVAGKKVIVKEANLVKDIFWRPEKEITEETNYKTIITSSDPAVLNKLTCFVDRAQKLYGEDSSSSSEISIYGYGSEKKLTTGKFYAINNTGDNTDDESLIETLAGNKHKLISFDIAANSEAVANYNHAGLFAASGTISISDLFMTNTTVTAGSYAGDAGTLIGYIASGEVSIKNSGVYYENYRLDGDEIVAGSKEENGRYTNGAWNDTKTKGLDESGKYTIVTTLETRFISAEKGSAGGLVGAVAKGARLKIGADEPETRESSTVTSLQPEQETDQTEEREEDNGGSFASVKVSGLNAGGLVGKSEGFVSVINSFSGGHTLAFEYSEASETGTTGTTEYLYDESLPNVVSVAAENDDETYAAGGLIGQIGENGTVRISNAYSTSSVGSETSNYVWLGGLIGYDASKYTVGSSGYDNCYSAGLVEYKTDKLLFEEAGEKEAVFRAGAFAGKMDSDNLIQGNYCLSGINVGMDLVANPSGDLDEDKLKSASENDIKENNEGAETYAYTRSKEDSYPLRLVNETTPFGGTVTAKSEDIITYIHMGDWQNAYAYLPVEAINGNRLTVKVTVPKTVDFVTLQIFGSVSGSDSAADTIPVEEINVTRDNGTSSLLRANEATNSATLSLRPYTNATYASKSEWFYEQKDSDNDIFYIALDDITDRDGHFKQICPNLIPGENLLIFARCGRVTMNANAKRRVAEKIKEAIKTGTDESTGAFVTESGQEKLEAFVTGDTSTTIPHMAVTNSLYGYSDAVEASGDTPAKPAEYTLTTAGTETTGEGAGSKTTATLTGLAAKIYSIRHLENLSSAVSGVPASAVIKAAQTRDLVWKDTVTVETEEDEANLYPYFDFLVKAKEIPEKGHINISKLPTGTAASGEEHMDDRYLPVRNTSLVSYDGGIYDEDGNVTGVRLIANLPIADGGEGAGLFAQFEPTATMSEGEAYTIKNLMIKNVLVAGGTSSNPYAGALAGTIKNTDVDNVLVYADRDSSTYNYGDLQIEGEYTTGIHAGAYTGVGGLIGSMNGGSVTNSASSVAVMTSAASAGGLIGNINGGSVQKCYAGGHTVNGKYSEVKETGTESAPTIYNVTANGYAGGLIGTAVSGSITNSYATTSVSGTTAGGFIGSPGGAAVSNAYATGLVSGDNAGAFAGTTEVTGNNLFYVTGVNADTVKGIAGTSSDGIVQPLDDLTLAGVTNTGAPAYRYDGTLNDGTFTVSPYALEEYPFTSVKSFSLPGEETTDNATGTFVHVGDWEDGYEHVLVVNTMSNS